MYRIPKYHNQQTIDAIKAKVELVPIDADMLTWTKAFELLRVVRAAMDELGVSGTEVLELWSRLERYLVARGVVRVIDLDGPTAWAWVMAPDNEGRPPAHGTQRIRRWSIRVLFWVLEHIYGTVLPDPTRNMALRFWRPPGPIALTDDEMARMRAAALSFPKRPRYAAMWAMLEAGATASQLIDLRIEDCSPDGTRVRLPKSYKNDAFSIELEGEAAVHVANWLKQLSGEPDGLVFYRGPLESRQVRVHRALEAIFHKSRVRPHMQHRDSRIQPASIRVAVGQRIFRETGRIDEVARRLGIRSLDAAARLIGFDWKEGEESA